jgi:hypothetical protein
MVNGRAIHIGPFVPSSWFSTKETKGKKVEIVFFSSFESKNH